MFCLYGLELVFTVFSMTGFGRGSAAEQGLSVTVEIRSVNHRFFEFSCRCPKAYQFLDEKLKSLCNSKISRGKTELSVIIEDNSKDAVSVAVNSAYAEAYIGALRKTAKDYKLKNDVKVSSLIGVPDMFTLKRRDISEELITKLALEAAAAALDGFLEMRAAEGERLKQDVLNRTDLILSKVAFIEERSPQTVKAYRQRLEEKIRELLDNAEIDEQRLITETAIFADKVAVAEETVRLRSHIKALSELFGGGGAIGRKLDFLVQEMNRETNTIGSKAQDIEIAHTVVDIKAEIEKIREQIQNIE